MKDYLKNVSLLVLALVLAGCASTGNRQLGEMDRASCEMFVQDNVTTKSELISMFGDPQEVDFDHTGKEKWIYKFTKSTVKPINFVPVVSMFKKGTDDTNKRLVIVFDDDGRVLRHAYSESQGETTTGLIG